MIINVLSNLYKYFLASLGYYGVWEVVDGKTATADNIFAIKAAGADVVVTVISAVGNVTSIQIKDGSIEYGRFKSVNPSGGTVLVYPIKGIVTIT